MCILYVDDDAEDIEIFKDAVTAVDPSIQYIAARSGKDLFELLNQESVTPDHIILDINMPGMDGKACLSEIRKQEKFDHINVIVYSTNSFPKDIEQIQSLGATFIRKANSFKDLCNMVRTLRDSGR